MTRDPIVEEIRKARSQLENLYGKDERKYLDHVYLEQKKLKGKIVSRGPKRLIKSKAA